MAARATTRRGADAAAPAGARPRPRAAGGQRRATPPRRRGSSKQGRERGRRSVRCSTSSNARDHRVRRARRRRRRRRRNARRPNAGRDDPSPRSRARAQARGRARQRASAGTPVGRVCLGESSWRSSVACALGDRERNPSIGRSPTKTAQRLDRPPASRGGDFPSMLQHGHNRTETDGDVRGLRLSTATRVAERGSFCYPARAVSEAF